MTADSIERFFRSYLIDLSESFFVRSVIDSRTRDQIRALANKAIARKICEQLQQEGLARITAPRMVLRLKTLREINGRHFPHIEVMVSQRPRRKRRTCFVGHRFTPQIANALRWNLRQLLEPYNIKLDWSGRDPGSVQIFHDIVRRIKRADFCVFDTRSTRGRPNVYIEAGIAYAVGTPFILFEYVPKRSSQAPIVADIPSDLSHAFSLRYSDYKTLFRKFYISLPAFAERNF